MPDLPSWVTEAARLPLAFAQVREDPLLDLWVVEQIGRGARVLMIASGGCTAAYLAASGLVSRLHLVDLNPAQIALTRLKLRLLQTTSREQRLALLGHSPLESDTRARLIIEELAALGLPANALGPAELWSDVGPDQAGRYERVFAQLRLTLSSVSEELAELLQLDDLEKQTGRSRADTKLGKAIDRALDEVMDLPNLVALFSEQATRNRVELFSRHFAHRTRVALASRPARTNPYLWQMYCGQFYGRFVYPWLAASVPVSMPEVQCIQSDMVSALRRATPIYDFVHLSNILDWLTVEEAKDTLELAFEAAAPRGWVLIRQLNSNLDIPALGPGFAWQTKQGEILHDRDRSFFYRALHLGRKR